MIATGTYTAETKSTVFLLIRRPSLLPVALILRPTMALDTPPMVVAIEHQDRNVRSLAAQHTHHSTAQRAGELKRHDSWNAANCLLVSLALSTAAHIYIICTAQDSTDACGLHTVA